MWARAAKPDPMSSTAKRAAICGKRMGALASLAKSSTARCSVTSTTLRASPEGERFKGFKELRAQDRLRRGVDVYRHPARQGLQVPMGRGNRRHLKLGGEPDLAASLNQRSGGCCASPKLNLN